MPDATLIFQFLSEALAPVFWIAGGFAVALVLSLFVLSKFKELIQVG